MLLTLDQLNLDSRKNSFTPLLEKNAFSSALFHVGTWMQFNFVVDVNL